MTAERAGLPTAQVTATRSAAKLPFGAVAPLLPEQPGPPGTVDDRTDLLRRTVAGLAERVADERPLLLFVDDAHLLDDASATLVHQAASTGAALVLATIRTGEPAPDTVVALWKDGLATRIELEGLGAEAIEELLTTVLGGPVDPAAAAQFLDRCQGNALFLRELVAGALRDGTLHEESGLWRLARDLSPSPRLVEIVEAHLGWLDQRERDLLELVSYGEPLGQAELEQLADPELAEDLERRALLTSEVDGRRLEVRLAHPLYGDVIRARTPALRARTIARELADATDRADRLRDDDRLRVAEWRLQAGGGPPDTMLDGARIARWRYDFHLAERLARAAVDAGAGFEAELLAAQLASLQGRREEAERELASLAATVERTGDEAQRAQVALARFDNSGTWWGTDLFGVLDEAGDGIRDPEWRDRLEARRVGVIHNRRGPRAGAAVARPLLERASGEALVIACLVGAGALLRLGRIDEAIETSERGLAAQQEHPDPLAWYPWWHTATRGEALLQAGQYAEACELIAVQHQRALDERSAEAQAMFAQLEAMAVGERGRVRTAATRARESLVIHRGLDRPLLIRRDLIYGALALALGGDAEGAAALLEELDALDLPPLLSTEVDRLEARAWTAAARGDLVEARTVLARAADLGADVGDRVGEASALHGLARLGCAREVADRLAAVADGIDGDLAPARAAHARALAADDPRALEAASERFEAIGADLLAAEAAADAAGAHHRAGDAREAAAAERRAALLAERAEDPATPSLDTIEDRARLTPAERETAELAAGGRSNREVAEQLFLSPRTVENRLQRVYEKLGISGRGELSAALDIKD